MGNMDPKALRMRVENISTIPTIPSVLKQLSTIIENPKVSLNEISHFISQDPALTTKILQMVNSALYGFPGRISSVNHAVMLLGLNVVKGLLLSVSVFEIMHKAMIGLREHSIGVAIVSREIARKKGLKEPEEVFVAGLLHDVGKVILTLAWPEEYDRTVREAESAGIAIFDAERNQFSETHAAVAGWLSEKWHFPKKLCECIANHHRPQTSALAPLETAMVHTADVIVKARGIGYSGDRLVPDVSARAWETLALSEADLRGILKELEDSVEQATEEFRA
ncbi:MAG: HDOD domain-containing protein [Pseudomonadota bacterium]|nr:HDOD domain-containing protein [Syntrophaceae bacterium]MDI9555397.1 HDOD domain-containing protein [Pseudomonadota bacterium]NLX30775.1 HDOD domain-containing protein [Deltaproteobacteria bacterium]HNU84277.1 HDOD domain-containing protein [Syntrophales bacterium]HNZ33788.1 HDOD domain-containing protein [Syntrophales bacterium]